MSARTRRPRTIRPHRTPSPKIVVVDIDLDDPSQCDISGLYFEPQPAPEAAPDENGAGEERRPK